MTSSEGGTCNRKSDVELPRIERIAKKELGGDELLCPTKRYLQGRAQGWSAWQMMVKEVGTRAH